MKKVLVVDVDETLLSIEPLFFLKKLRKDYLKYNCRFINFHGKEYYIAPRPGIREFLDKASSSFDLVAFSVIDRHITIQKLKALGIKGFFKKVYGREDLINKKKSLKQISEDLDISPDDIIAIDDAPGIFTEHSNIIPVKPFLMGKNQDDNLSGAINKALCIKHGIKVVSPVN